MAQFYLHTSKIPPPSVEIHGVERPQKRGYVRPTLSGDKDAKADAYCEEEKERRENLQNISLLLRTYKMNSQAHQTSKSTRTRDDSDIFTGFLNYGVSSSSHSSNSISDSQRVSRKLEGLQRLLPIIFAPISLQGQTPRFPRGGLKIPNSPGYHRCTIGGRMHQKSSTRKVTNPRSPQHTQAQCW